MQRKHNTFAVSVVDLVQLAFEPLVTLSIVANEY